MAKHKFHWGVKKTLSQDPVITDRLEALSEIKFSYVTKPIPDHYSCAKLMLGNKFFIVKVKTIQWLEMHLNQVLKAYNMGGTKDMYLPVVEYIHKKGHYDIKVKFICQSQNAYEVVKAEYIALQENEGKQRFLNRSTEPYIPKWNPTTKKFGWLSQAQFLAYKKLVKKYTNTDI